MDIPLFLFKSNNISNSLAQKKLNCGLFQDRQIRHLHRFNPYGFEIPRITLFVQNCLW